MLQPMSGRTGDDETLLALACAVMGISTAAADRLVAAGLVRREASPRNRRELALQVAPDGDAVLDRYDEDRLDGLRAALARLPDDDRTTALAAFAAFARTAALVPR